MNIQYCIDMAAKQPYMKGQSRHYACLVNKKGQIIAESANSYSVSHTKQFHYAKKVGRPEAIFLHSEMACLLKDRKRQGVKLFVARVDSKNRPCYSAPCEICVRALQDYSNVKSIEFSL